jgi:hypothetical protein
MDLLARQAALQAEARDLLAVLDGLFAGAGPLRPTGSYVSGLMAWRDLDVMLLGGPGFRPRDVLALLGRVVDLPEVTGFDYRDERGPSFARRDERFHVALTYGAWRVDLSIWLHDAHANVTRWHEELRDRVSPEQRLAILRIKDAWCRRPEYPDEVSGLEIYTAVLEHGLLTPEAFGPWLASQAGG